MKRGRGGSSRGGIGRGTKTVASTSRKPVNTVKNKQTGTTKGKSNEKTSKEDKLLKEKRSNAAICIQKYIRMFLARTKFEILKKDRIDYLELMEKLEREAWLSVVNKEREEREKEDQREAEERRKKKEHNQRKKKMLEAAFDGDVEEIRKLINDIETKVNKEHKDTTDRVVIQREIEQAKLSLINCQDANNNSPLSEAAAGQQLETSRLLFSLGADVNSIGAFNRTPIYRAAFSGAVDVAKLLLDLGADPRLHDSNGSAPLEIAASPEIQELLKEWDITRTDEIINEKQKKLEEMRNLELEKGKENVFRLKNVINEAKKRYHANEMMLRKCFEELRKRTREHDKHYLGSKADLTLQALKEAESSVQLAIAEEKASRIILQNLNEEAKELESMGDPDENEAGILKCHIKELSDIVLKDVGNKIKNESRWPLIIDSSNRAVTFLRYCDTNYLNAFNYKDLNTESVRKALLGGIRFGKPVVIDMMDANMLPIIEDVFNSIQDNLYHHIMSKEILTGEKYLSLVRSHDEDEYQSKHFIHSRVNEFKLIFATKSNYLPQTWHELFLTIKIIISEV